ncbi:hypothetical protein DFH28DRAFT_1087975 [Melampsora americana]|nr:hypothetical protein DFH28DRAFT_1087975 [Melampsora americana]
MVVSNNTNYYIYKPLQLVVSIFFFQQDNCLMARCLPALVIPDPDIPTSLRVIIPDVHAFNSDQLFTIKCNDFWRPFPRIEVAAKVIRHKPISVYSDNTLGGVSKKWNKHMCIYFTLAEFKIHFFATSNFTLALELFDQVIDDLNDHSKKGFIAYNHTIGKDVWVIPVVLFHLGDSPMHTKITNTLNPANTLTPCCMWNLKVPKKAEKESDLFVRDSLGLDAYGDKVQFL